MRRYVVIFSKRHADKDNTINPLIGLDAYGVAPGVCLVRSDAGLAELRDRVSAQLDDNDMVLVFAIADFAAHNTPRDLDQRIAAAV